MQKPEQMHVPGDKTSASTNTQKLAFTLKELIRLEGMKWLQERGLQYESSHDDGKDLYLRSSHPRQ